MKPLLIVDKPLADQINAAIAANLKNVTRWSTPVLAYSAGAAAAVVVQHDLGSVPNVIRVEPLVDTRWWSDVDDRNAWTAESVIFRTAHGGQFMVTVGVK